MKKNILYVLLIFISIACDLTKEDKKNTVRGDIVSIPITEMETDYGKLSDFAEDIKMIDVYKRQSQRWKLTLKVRRSFLKGWHWKIWKRIG